MKYLLSEAICCAQSVSNEKNITVTEVGIPILQKICDSSNYSTSINEPFALQESVQMVKHVEICWS